MAKNKKKDGASAPSLALSLSGISKSFGPVHANRDVALDVHKGSIHGIIGENGAGKSTLMNILYGLYSADAGQIAIDGKPVRIASSSDAIAHGIGMVHQHFMLVKTFTVLENVMLGAEKGFQLDSSVEATRAQLKKMGDEYGLSVDPDTLISDLPVGLQQRVEILKALRGANILILDEPTGVLTPQETQGLFEILRALRDEGTTILFITHKLHEIMALTDRVSVMRQGEMVAHRETAKTDMEELAQLMVGRKVLLQVERTKVEAGEPVLQVRDLEYVDAAGVKRVDGLSFDVRAGELLSVAGVAGNGQTELLYMLSGILAPTGGSIEIGGAKVTADNPVDAAHMRDLGVSHVPEDRHNRGLVLPFDAKENSILGHHNDRELGGLLFDRAAIAERATRQVTEFDVRPPNIDLRAAQFSGGNQQKLVLAREIDAAPSLLLIGQPTRGVDIGAIEFIYSRLMEMRAAGCAILLVSVELEEVMSLSDRILVMMDGRQIGIVDRDAADENMLGLMMAGVSSEKAA